MNSVLELKTVVNHLNSKLPSGYKARTYPLNKGKFRIQKNFILFVDVEISKNDQHVNYRNSWLLWTIMFVLCCLPAAIVMLLMKNKFDQLEEMAKGYVPQAIAASQT